MKQKFMAGICLVVFLVAGLISGPTAFAQQDGLKHIPDTAFAAATLRFKDSLGQPSMALVPHELIKVFGDKEFGVDLMKLERISFVLDPFDDLVDPPNFGFILQFSTPQDPNGRILDEMNREEIAGMQVWTMPLEEQAPKLIQVDDSTYLFAMPPMIDPLINAANGDSKLIRMMKAVPATDHFDIFIDIEPMRDFIAENLPPEEQVPPPFNQFLSLPDLISTIQIRQDVSDNGVSEITITSNNEADAERLEKMLTNGVDLARQGGLSAMAVQMGGADPAYQQATMDYSHRLAETVKEAIHNSRQGDKLVIDLSKTQQVSGVAVTGVLIGMLLPAVQQVREAARRTQSMNNMRQMVLACLNYESAHGHWPAQAICDADGKPLLSWRVTILPYMEEQALYEEFHLDEPWDSDHNIQLLDKMPPSYANPNFDMDGMTSYLGAAGEKMVFHDGRELGFGDITDGSSNTIVLVEADQWAAVEWSKPQDLNVDLDNPAMDLGGLRPAGFNAAMMDGSVHMINQFIDAETLSNLFQYDDGNVVENWDW